MSGDTKVSEAFAALIKERAELTARLQKVEVAISSLSPLVNGSQAALFAEDSKPHAELMDALQEIISDGKTHNLEDLENKAKERGFFFSGKSGGRAIHMRMVSLKNKGRAEKLPNGWRAAR